MSCLTRNYAKEIVTLINEASEAYNHANGEWSRLDSEFNDLTHAFELLKLNAADMARTSSDMKRNRIERRKHKEEVERLKSFMSWTEENKLLVNNLKGVATHIDRITKQQNERMYTPRVRTDLNKRFREDLRR